MKTIDPRFLRKVTSLLLAVLLIASIVPVGVFSAMASTGTDSDIIDLDPDSGITVDGSAQFTIVDSPSGKGTVIRAKAAEYTNDWGGAARNTAFKKDGANITLPAGTYILSYDYYSETDNTGNIKMAYNVTGSGYNVEPKTHRAVLQSVAPNGNYDVELAPMRVTKGEWITNSLRVDISEDRENLGLTIGKNGDDVYIDNLKLIKMNDHAEEYPAFSDFVGAWYSTKPLSADRLRLAAVSGDLSAYFLTTAAKETLTTESNALSLYLCANSRVAKLSNQLNLPISLSEKSKYALTFSWKSSNATSNNSMLSTGDASVALLHTASSNTDERVTTEKNTIVELLTEADFATNDALSNEYKTKTVYFETTEKVEQLYLAVYNSANTNKETNASQTVLIDDIKFTWLSSARTVTVSFDSNGGNTLADKEVVVGEAINYPVPVKFGYRFEGWFADKAFTEAAPVNAPDAQSVTYYAKWTKPDAVIIDFEDNFAINQEIADGLTSGTVFRAASYDVDNVLAMPSADRGTYNGQERVLKFNDGTHFMSVEAGKRYEITYSYYITNRHGDADSTLFTEYNSSWNSNAGVWFAENFSGTTALDMKAHALKNPKGEVDDLVDLDNDALNTWLTDTVVVDISVSGVIGMKAQYLWADIYFDDIIIREITKNPVTVNFDSMGGSAVESINTVSGDAVDLPEPTKKDYSFDGWYSDATYTVPAGKYAPDANTTYYAKWVEQRDTVIDFEGKFLSGDTDRYGSGYFKKKTLSGDEHKAVLAYTDVVNNNARAHKLSHNGKLVTLRANADYIVTFDYFVEELPATSSFEFDFVTDFGIPAYGNYTRLTGGNILSDVKADAENIKGRWKTGTTLIKTPADIGDGTLGVFATAGKDAVIYFDNIKLELVDSKSGPALFIDYGYDGKTEILRGTAGQAITLADPIREGYDFDGWFKDASFKTRFTAKKYPDSGITVVYAAWNDPTPRIVTFEDMPEKFAVNDAKIGRYVSAACYTIVAGKGQNGTKALRAEKTDNGEKRFTLNQGDANLTVKKDRSYKVVIHYYFEEKSSNLQVSAFSGGGGTNYWGSTACTGSYATLGGEKGKWLESSFTFTSEKEGPLFLSVTGGANSIAYIDNIEVYELSVNTVTVNFVNENIGYKKTVMGKIGEKLPIPDLSFKNVDFGGWYVDKDYKVAFKSTVFPQANTTVYGKFTEKAHRVVNFSDYPYAADTSGTKFSGSLMSIADISSDGDGKSLLYDNTLSGKTTGYKYLILGAEDMSINVEKGAQYLVTFDYYIDYSDEITGHASLGFNTCIKNSMWKENTKASEIFQIETAGATPKRTWIAGASVVTVSADHSTDDIYLLMRFYAPYDVKLYVDNINILKVEKGMAAVAFTSNRAKVPSPMLVKEGTKVNLPVLETPKGYSFVGWVYNDEVVSNTVIAQGIMVLDGTFTVLQVKEDFENIKVDSGFNLNSFGIDADWEYYDSRKAGNSADNVYSGRYSLHRIGDEPGFKAYNIYTNIALLQKKIAFASIYTVSMWVKIDDPVHTLGAIEISNPASRYNPWSINSDERIPVAAIADIADGQWHKISATFTSMSCYLAIITPGNLSIYIDDIVVDHTPGAALSIYPEYENYIPAFLTEDGEYVIENENSDNILEPYTIVAPGEDAQKSVNASFVGKVLGNPVLLTLAICIMLIILGAASCVIVITKSKRKAGK